VSEKEANNRFTSSTSSFPDVFNDAVSTATVKKRRIHLSIITNNKFGKMRHVSRYYPSIWPKELRKIMNNVTELCMSPLDGEMKQFVLTVREQCFVSCL